MPGKETKISQMEIWLLPSTEMIIFIETTQKLAAIIKDTPAWGTKNNTYLPKGIKSNSLTEEKSRIKGIFVILKIPTYPRGTFSNKSLNVHQLHLI